MRSVTLVQAKPCRASPWVSWLRRMYEPLVELHMTVVSQGHNVRSRTVVSVSSAQASQAARRSLPGLPGEAHAPVTVQARGPYGRRGRETGKHDARGGLAMLVATEIRPLRRGVCGQHLRDAVRIRCCQRTALPRKPNSRSCAKVSAPTHTQARGFSRVLRRGRDPIVEHHRGGPTVELVPRTRARACRVAERFHAPDPPACLRGGT